MKAEDLPFLTFEALSRIRIALNDTDTPQGFLRDVDEILQDSSLVAAGDLAAWPELTKNEDGDGANSVALWRHTTHDRTAGFGRSQATDGRLWTCLAFGRYRNYMSNRWPLEAPGLNNWKKRAKNRWIMPAEPTSKAGLRHGIARLWWIACLTGDDNSIDMALTHWILSEERLVIDLLDRFVTMSEPTRYAVLDLMVKNHGGLHANKRRRFMVELNNIAGIRDLDSMSEHHRTALLQELIDKA